MLKKAIEEKSKMVTNDTANNRALSIVPKIKELKKYNTKNSIPKNILDLIHKEGLFRYFQPKEWGGMELDFQAWLDIPEIISRGDCSTGWIVANMASHHRTLAVFDEEIQKEIWSANPDALIAAGNIYQQGKGRKVPDGIILSGVWNFCSGIEISEWCFFAFMLEENGNKDNSFDDYLDDGDSGDDC